MKSPMIKLLCCLLILGAASLSACVEYVDPLGDAQDEVTRQSPISIQPEFSIEGIERLNDVLVLEQLGLSISEIRLEPLDGEDDLAYSFVRPQQLRFDISSGQRSVLGEPIELPRAGRYLVSIRVEPVNVRGEDGNTQRSSSFAMSGQVAYTTEEQSAKPGTMSEGPIPRPFRNDVRPKGEDGGSADGSSSNCRFKRCPAQTWAPFSYHSERAIFYTIDEVHIADGSQHLSFSFDIESWGAEVAEPISRAVGDHSVVDPADPAAPPPAFDHKHGFDITRQLDSMGYGIDALVERAFVEIDRTQLIP